MAARYYETVLPLVFALCTVFPFISLVLLASPEFLRSPAQAHSSVFAAMRGLTASASLAFGMSLISLIGQSIDWRWYHRCLLYICWAILALALAVTSQWVRAYPAQAVAWHVFYVAATLLLLIYLVQGQLSLLEASGYTGWALLALIWASPRGTDLLPILTSQTIFTYVALRLAERRGYIVELGDARRESRLAVRQYSLRTLFMVMLLAILVLGVLRLGNLLHVLATLATSALVAVVPSCFLFAMIWSTLYEGARWGWAIGLVAIVGVVDLTLGSLFTLPASGILAALTLANCQGVRIRYRPS